jgi:hypothetical protein
VTNQCYFRTCSECKNKAVEFNANADVFEDDAITFDTWEKIKETGKDGKICQRVVKIKKEGTVAELCDKFLLVLPDYMAHVGRRRHQYKVLKTLKLDSRDTTDILILHCDFSENYSCKNFRVALTLLPLSPSLSSVPFSLLSPYFSTLTFFSFPLSNLLLLTK